MMRREPLYSTFERWHHFDRNARLNRRHAERCRAVGDHRSAERYEYAASHAERLRAQVESERQREHCGA